MLCITSLKPSQTVRSRHQLLPAGRIICRHRGRPQVRVRAWTFASSACASTATTLGTVAAFWADAFGWRRTFDEPD
jgi:hypothetical protein